MAKGRPQRATPSPLADEALEEYRGEILGKSPRKKTLGHCLQIVARSPLLHICRLLFPLDCLLEEPVLGGWRPPFSLPCSFLPPRFSGLATRWYKGGLLGCCGSSVLPGCCELRGIWSETTPFWFGICCLLLLLQGDPTEDHRHHAFEPVRPGSRCPRRLRPCGAGRHRRLLEQQGDRQLLGLCKPDQQPGGCERRYVKVYFSTVSTVG